MSLNEDLMVSDDEATTGAAEMNDADAYYERIMSQVDETIEETKKERERRSHEVEAHASHEGYVVEFFVTGISPLQAMAYISDPDNMRYFNPLICEARTVREERDDATGVDFLELRLRYRRTMFCVPIFNTVTTKFCLEKDRDELVCYEKHGYIEKTHTYRFEEESNGTRVIDHVRVHVPKCASLLTCASPLSTKEHIRCMQRLKKILEADDPFLLDDDPSAKLLFTDL